MGGFSGEAARLGAWWFCCCSETKGQGESARAREMASGRRRAWTLVTRVWMSEVIHPGEWSETEQGREGSILP